MKNLRRGARALQAGFTIFELMVVVAIGFILSAIAFPHIAGMNGQMQAGEDIRVMAHVLGQMRAEAIRLRTKVSVTFTTTGFSWDIDSDGTTDGSFKMHTNTKWSGATPAAITFNGLGLVRALGATSRTLTVTNAGYVLAATINSNGHIDL